MKKLIFIYGIIGGLIAGCWGTFGAHIMPKDTSISTLIWLGYTSMIVGFAFIFVALKNYRDNFGDGYISFAKSLQIGLLITLVASTLYVTIWLVGEHLMYPHFIEKYSAQLKLQMQAGGKSATEISNKMDELARYNNPLYKIFKTYGEIVPAGVVISLIAALILGLKRKPTASA